ncbi:MAG: PepSY domain-containing protein [Moraxella osloensis]
MVLVTVNAAPNRDPQMGNTGMPPVLNPAQNQPPRTPSYQIEVVKGQEVYHVKVDAQTRCCERC